ncbi:MAG: threonylcarbamoyl-AMP synthase [Flavobacteriaceae bacterium]|nr:MAG: threonylcarbamoyl-AMP synthase [Flavobacteriaceae bacterium]
MKEEVSQVVELLKQGKTILYPTDTVWGLGCDAKNIDAVRRIMEIKNRSAQKSFVLLVDSDARLQEYVSVPDLAWDLMDLSEKPLTLVYQNPKGLPREILAEDGSIAIRKVKDDFCQNIIKRLNSPIVSTSANLSGRPTPQHFGEIEMEIKNQVDYVCLYRQDQTTPAEASSIISLTIDGKVKVIRP